MKAKTLLVLAGVTAPLILTGSVSAGFVGIKVVQKLDGQAAGLFVCNVYAVFDRPDDEMSAVAGTPNNPLNIFVKQGKFYQNPLGSSFTAPLQELLPADPLLQFDTFVTIGVKSDVFADTSDDVFVSAGFPPFENDSLSTNNGAWFVLPGSPNPGGSDRTYPA